MHFKNSVIVSQSSSSSYQVKTDMCDGVLLWGQDFGDLNPVEEYKFLKREKRFVQLAWKKSVLRAIDN